MYGDEEDDLSRGNTTIVAPGGMVIEGPLVGAADTLEAALDLDRVTAGRRAFDPTGHYARPDVLALTARLNSDNG
jgi:nitrilase